MEANDFGSADFIYFSKDGLDGEQIASTLKENIKRIIDDEHIQAEKAITFCNIV